MNISQLKFKGRLPFHSLLGKDPDHIAVILTDKQEGIWNPVGSAHTIQKGKDSKCFCNNNHHPQQWV